MRRAFAFGIRFSAGLGGNLFDGRTQLPPITSRQRDYLFHYLQQSAKPRIPAGFLSAFSATFSIGSLLVCVDAVTLISFAVEACAFEAANSSKDSGSASKSARISLDLREKRDERLSTSPPSG